MPEYGSDGMFQLSYQCPTLVNIGSTKIRSWKMENKIGVLTFQKVAKTGNIGKKVWRSRNFAGKHRKQVPLYFPFSLGKNRFSP